MVVALAVVLLKVHEPHQIEAAASDPERDPKKGVIQNLKTVIQNPDKSGLFVLLGILLWFMAFNALETGLSSFAVFTLGITAGKASIYAATVTFSFLAFSVPAGLIAVRLGRRKTILIGLTGLTILFGLGFFIVQNVPTFIGLLVITGFFWAMVNVNSLPMVYDYGDERRIGAYTGLYYFSSQMAAVLGPTLGGVLVQAMSNQYRWLFVFATVFMALAWVVMTQVKEKRLA
jgi:MFS family permease